MEYTKTFYENPVLLRNVDSKTVTDLKVSKVSELTLSKVAGMIVMSHADFVNGGKYIKGVPVAITPDGSFPKPIDELIEEPIKEPIDEKIISK